MAESDRETERERERLRETERDRERQRETERDRERQRETERDRENGAGCHDFQCAVDFAVAVAVAVSVCVCCRGDEAAEDAVRCQSWNAGRVGVWGFEEQVQPALVRKLA